MPDRPRILLPAGDSQSAADLIQSAQLLDTLSDGLAVVDAGMRILWCNRTFAEWCASPPQGQNFYDALGSPAILPDEGCPFHKALRGQVVSKHLSTHDSRLLELHISQQAEDRLLALCRDVTEDIHHQQQLDALHKAGSELASLDATSLAEMGPAQRIEMLKQNIHRCTRELLHYDVLDLRLLDRRTGRLEPLLIKGMSAEASKRQLIANPVNNGVTGYVASTGKSYLCRDTATDPLYIEGAAGMRSSMTVPIVYQDEVVGTFNVESPQVNAFNDQDVQFLETFCRDLASALHTLELLTAEKRETASQAIENISRGVALPVDEILSAGASLLERYIGVEAEMADRIRLILNQARLIKQCIQKVGETIVPPSESTSEEQPFKGMRVLVADNDEHVRLAAHGILGRWGCEVETARDGKEALALARQSSYDAILADIRLPDMTGYDVYRKLRAAQPAAQVVLMTEYGYDPSHSLVKARQDGLKHVLFKPFRIDQLRDALAGCWSSGKGGKPAS